MRILHPDEQKHKSLAELEKYFYDGYYSIISKEEQKRLNYFLRSFEDYRSQNNLKITNNDLYSSLPFSLNTLEWKSRQQDIFLINNLFKNKKGIRILDLGTWNGWLCNYYAKKGHEVVGIDIFTDENDGLKAVKNYTTHFTLLQLYPDDLYRIDSSFDLIIFNRNWAFIKDKEKALLDAKNLLKTDGQILLTGLSFWKKIPKINYLTKLDAKFRETYNIPILYKDSKGFLDLSDKIFLEKKGFKLNTYNTINNKLKYFIPQKLSSYYATIKTN